MNIINKLKRLLYVLRWLRFRVLTELAGCRHSAKSPLACTAAAHAAKISGRRASLTNVKLSFMTIIMSVFDRVSATRPINSDSRMRITGSVSVTGVSTKGGGRGARGRGPQKFDLRCEDLPVCSDDPRAPFYFTMKIFIHQNTR